MRPLAVALVAAGVLSSCGGGAKGGVTSVKIAEQFGLPYAPMTYMKERQLVHAVNPNVRIDWTTLASGSNVTEALVAGQIDCGAEAVPPFLVGWDKHVPAKIATSLGDQPYVLVTSSSAIHSIRDFHGGQKIGVPSPASVQATLIRLAAKRQAGNAHALDANLQSVPNPDAASALISRSGSLVAHFANEPYFFQELAVPGLHEVLNSYDLIGRKAMAIALVCRTSFFSDQRQAYDAVMAAVAKATASVRGNPADAAQVLAGPYKTPAPQLEQWLTYSGNVWDTKLDAVMKWVEVQREVGGLKNVPKSCQDLAFANAAGSCT